MHRVKGQTMALRWNAVYRARDQQYGIALSAPWRWHSGVLRSVFLVVAGEMNFLKYLLRFEDKFTRQVTVRQGYTRKGACKCIPDQRHSIASVRA